METQISPEVQKSTETALTVIDVAKGIVISTTHEYQFAQTVMGDIKKRIKELEEVRFGQTRPIDEAKKKILDFFRPPLQKLNDAKDHLNQIMVKFVDDQERKRREEERKLQEAARKRAEEDALQAALEAEAAGEKEEAEEILETPVYVPPIKVVSEIPKSKESHLREIWDCDAFDLNLTVKAIAEGKAPIESVQYNITFLNAQARAYKSALNIPGTKAKNRKIQI